MLLILMLNITGSCINRGAQKHLYHLPAHHDGVSVHQLLSTPHLGHNCPQVGAGGEKGVKKLLHGAGQHRWMIDQCDQSCITPAAQNFLQTNPQRTELSALGFTIDGNKRAMRVCDRLDGGLVLVCNYDDKVGVSLEQIDGG